MQVSTPPIDTDVTSSGTLTVVGLVPYTQPQHDSAPSRCMAQLWSLPAEIATASNRREMRCGQ